MKKYIKKEVLKLLKKHKTNDPEELANRMGIMIIDMPLGSNAGSYRFMKNHKVIFVNSDLDYHQRKVVIAHELGHAILHPKTNCCFIKNKTLLLSSKIEREANIFACELLIHDDLLKDYIDYSLNEIANAEYLPVELLELNFN